MELSNLMPYVGTVGSTLFNVGSTLLTNRANRKLAEYQYDQERQMIAEQNEYNSPANQLQRYRDAGLNPNLIYGQVSEGNQTNIANYQRPTLQAPQISMDELFSFAKNIEELKSLKLQNFWYDRQQNNDDLLKNQQILTSEMENAFNSALIGFPIYNNYSTYEGFYDRLENGLRYKKYQQDINTQQNLNDYRNALIKLNNLNAKEKQFTLEQLNPLLLENKALSNERLKQIMMLSRGQFGVNSGTQVGKLVLELLKLFK